MPHPAHPDRVRFGISAGEGREIPDKTVQIVRGQETGGVAGFLEDGVLAVGSW